MHPRPESLSLRSLVRTALLATLALACGGEGAPPAGEAQVAVDSGAGAPESAPPVAGGSRLLAAACLSGDPARGREWQLDLGDPTLVPLDLILLDSLEPREASRQGNRIAHAANRLPEDTSVANFWGLPVVIRDAWLLVAAPDDTSLVAIVSRRLPIESAPMEELTALVAVSEPQSGAARTLSTQWSVRRAGPEDEVEARDPVAAFASPGGTIHLLFARESRGRTRVEAISRTRGARWGLAWEGVLPSCPADLLSRP